MSFVAGWVAIGVGAFAAYGSKKQSSIDARILRENAADLRELAKSNAEAYKYAGEVNADAVLTVGEANATMVERETVRALQMYGLEAAEERRLHVLSEKQVAGDIRATVGGSGVMTNTGSPLHYLHSQVKLGIQTRRFGDLKTYWSLKNIQESGEDKAAVIRLTAEQEARSDPDKRSDQCTDCGGRCRTTGGRYGARRARRVQHERLERAECRTVCWTRHVYLPRRVVQFWRWRDQLQYGHHQRGICGC